MPNHTVNSCSFFKIVKPPFTSLKFFNTRTRGISRNVSIQKFWLHSLKVAQLLRSAACLHTNQSRSYLNHLVSYYIYYYRLMMHRNSNINLFKAIAVASPRRAATANSLDFSTYLQFVTLAPVLQHIPTVCYTRPSTSNPAEPSQFFILLRMQWAVNYFLYNWRHITHLVTFRQDILDEVFNRLSRTKEEEIYILRGLEL